MSTQSKLGDFPSRLIKIANVVNVSTGTEFIAMESGFETVAFGTNYGRYCTGTFVFF